MTDEKGRRSFEVVAEEQEVLRTLSILVDNEPGVLARVVGLFSGRGYNIESLTVSETVHNSGLSRITIVTRARPAVLVQIRNLLERLIPVHRVVDLTLLALEEKTGMPLERELALVKVVGEGSLRVEALRLAEAFGARLIDATSRHFIFEMTGELRRVNQFIAVLQPLGLVEVSRTGVAALSASPHCLLANLAISPEEGNLSCATSPPSA